MKMTTAMLISALAFAPVAVLAQNAGGTSTPTVTSGGTITINAIMVPLVAPKVVAATPAFNVNHAASLAVPTSSTLSSRMNSRQLQAIPMENRDVLSVLGTTR